MISLFVYHPHGYDSCKWTTAQRALREAAVRAAVQRAIDERALEDAMAAAARFVPA